MQLSDTYKTTTINSPEHNEMLEIKTAETQYHSLYRFPFVVVEYSTIDIIPTNV